MLIILHALTCNYLVYNIFFQLQFMCAMNYHFIINLLIFNRKSSHQALKRKKRKNNFGCNLLFCNKPKFHPHSCEVCLNLELTAHCRGGRKVSRQVENHKIKSHKLCIESQKNQIYCNFFCSTTSKKFNPHHCEGFRVYLKPTTHMLQWQVANFLKLNL